MKSIDLQNVVLSKLKIGEKPTKISCDLNGLVSRSTIYNWIIQLSKQCCIKPEYPLRRKRSARSATAIQTVKRFLKSKSRKSVRTLGRKLGVSKSSAHRLLAIDLHCKPYKIIREPRLTEKQKSNRVKFSNWVKHNFTKSQTKNFVFSDEKLFAVDGVHNRQNERVWAVSRREADKHGAIRQVSKFPGNIMVWLGVCTKGVSRVVFLENGSVTQAKYEAEVLSVALRLGNKHFGTDWTFQQDRVTANTAGLTQKWCTDHMTRFIE